MKSIFRKIIGPRPWRRLIFAFLWLITLFALFHAIENYRGRKAWSQWQAKLAARGESTKFEDHIPKEIPDSQNFAATPFVDSWFERRSEPVLDDLYARTTPPFPEEKYEYKNHARRRPINLEGWALAFREASLTNSAAEKRRLRNNAATNEVNIDRSDAAHKVLEALNSSDSAFQQLKDASSRPKSRYPVDYATEDPFSILLPHLAKAKSLMMRLQLRAAAHLALGETNEAYSDVKLMFRIAESFDKEPFIIGTLVQMSLSTIIQTVLWEGRQVWSDAQINEYQRLLLQPNYAQNLQTALAVERAAGIKTLDLMRQRGVKYYSAFIKGHFVPNNPFNTVATKLIPRGWFDMEKANIYKTHYELLLPSFDPTNRLFIPDIAAKNEKIISGYDIERMLPRPVGISDFLNHRLMATLLTPALVKTLQTTARSQAETHLCATALALELHKRKTGSYPENLASLTPTYIPKLPHDPIGGEPLKYRKTEDSYLLYSIGWNAKDDGGQPGKKFEELDFVW